jgi:hypothetical protein
MLRSAGRGDAGRPVIVFSRSSRSQVVAAAAVVAQQPKAPLTNEDVVRMKRPTGGVVRAPRSARCDSVSL